MNQKRIWLASRRRRPDISISILPSALHCVRSDLSSCHLGHRRFSILEGLVREWCCLRSLNRYFVHRLVCFNCIPGVHNGVKYGNEDEHPCDGRYEVHHHASGQLYPWRNSTRRNMVVLSKATRPTSRIFLSFLYGGRSSLGAA